MIAVVFAYTTVTNMIERPEGIKIASLFILAIVISSLVSRAARSTELRVHGFELDANAEQFIADADRSGSIRIIANRPDDGSEREYENKVREARNSHHLTIDDYVLFPEVRASQFTDVLEVQGVQVGPFRVLRCESPAIPNAIAALLMHIRDRTGTFRTSTSAGPRATRSPTSCSSSRSAKAIRPRSPAKCSASRSPIRSAGRASTSADVRV